MKTAIVYYSMSGNTEYAASHLAEAIGAELIRVEPVKAFPDSGFRKFFWGGKSAVMGERPALLPYRFDADEYGRVVIGSPIWAGRVAPPIRTFVEEKRDAIAKKRVVFLACSSGGDTKKAEKRLAELIGIDAFEATASLVDPKDKKSDKNEEALRDLIKALE